MVLVTCTLLVITMKCANTSCHCQCHCEPCRIHGVAICLPVLHLPQTLCHCEPCRIHGAAICLPVLHLPQALCHCEPCRIHGAAICLPVLHLPASPLSLRRNVVTDAICLQAALVFGLLRYARNDKKQDGRVVLKTPRHDNLLLDRHTTLAMTTCF